MSKYRNKIKLLLEELISHNILRDIHREYFAADEPKFFSYAAPLNSSKGFSDGKPLILNAGGFSFEDKELALLKCLGEAIERFSTLVFRKNLLTYSTFESLMEPALNPALFTNKLTTNNTKLGWVKGFSLDQEPYLIPAQVIYLNYAGQFKEPRLTQFITTGAAGGFDHESTILRGVYEVIERDAFMLTYLLKIRVPCIKLSTLENSRIDYIIQKAKRYNLELRVFDITNDLQIPSFLSVLIDRTGLGPPVSLGLKSSLSPIDAVIGSMEESFHTRPWMKHELLHGKRGDLKINPRDIKYLLERGLFWMSPKMLKHLDFLLNQPEKGFKLLQNEITPAKELRLVKNILEEKGFKVFYADITMKNFKKLGYLVYKVIIPELQPLFLNEGRREIRSKRVMDVSAYFGIEKAQINPVPHPFL